MKTQIQITKAPQDWDERPRAPFSGGFLQTTCWAEILQEYHQAKPVYFEVQSDDGKVICSLLALETGTSEKTLTWGEGPTFFTLDAHEQVVALRVLLKSVNCFAVENKISAISSSGFHPTYQLGNDARIRAVFEEAGFKAESWGTVLSGIDRPEDELFMAIDHSCRKAVKKARAAGAIVKKMANLEQYLKEFQEPYDVAKGQPASRRVGEIMWAKDQKGYYHYYVAQSAEGEFLGTLGMYVCHGVATEIASCLAPLAMQKKIPAQDLLHWEMFLDAKKLGCKYFDLAGVNPNPANDKEAGIRRFKEKWAGNYVEYLRYEKSFPSFLKSAKKMVKKLVGR